MKRVLGLLVLSGGLWGCEDPLLEAQRITNTRVLAARVEVAGEPDRAWPRPGEAASARWLVADPRPEPPLGWQLEACVAAPTTRGVPECRSAPFAFAASAGVGLEQPAIDFVMPDDAALAGSERVLIQGAVCADAMPELATALDATRCDGELRLVAFEVAAMRDLGNLNPSIGDETLTFDGAVWPAPVDLGRSECSALDAAPELPLVHAGGAEHRIATAFGLDDRDPVEGLDGPELEALFVSHAATLGRLERPVSVVEGGADEVAMDVRWKAPGSVDAPGRVARLYFVVRDFRGGTDWTVRTLCVVP